MPNRRKRKISNSSLELQLDPVSRQKVQDIFEKKFVYSKPNGSHWELPSDLSKHNDVWEVTELIDLKSTLNNLKDKLSDKDIVKWHQHTTFMNLAGNINTELRQTIRPELCTQAWCKFYEIVSTYSIIDANNYNVNSVHLCEAPGAFVTSLNHYLISSDYKGEWNWIGSTLNPYYEGNDTSEMIDDDRFVRGSHSNWDFGLDDTGNLMSWQNLQQLRDRAAGMGPVQLVTADGSIDCQGNPAEQETVVSRLHYCEALAAVLILSPGGNLVLKKFTMFECDTINLMYLLNCLFTQVVVFKPATSKSGNSEVYIISLGFKGLGDRRKDVEQLSQTFFSNLDTPCLFSKDDIPTDFLNQHIECCNYFTSLQQETIETNLIFYNNMSEEYMEQINSMKYYCTEIYFNKYHVKSIPGYMKITVPQKQQFSNYKYKELKRNEGTYHDRVKFQALPWEQKVLQFTTYDIDHNMVEWFQNCQQLQEESVKKWACTEGKQFSTIKSSRFCDVKLIEQMQEIKKKWKMNSVEVEITPAIVSVLDILFSNQTTDKHHVTIVSSAEINTEEIKQKEYIDNVSIETCIDKMNDKDTILVILDSDYSEVDIDSKKILLKCLIKIFTVMDKGSTLVIQMKSCLTRYTAGVIYLLSSCFEKVGFLPQPGHESEYQMLTCYRYTGVSDFLLQHCCHLVDKSDNVLETVPILTLLSDVQFVDFLTKCNETLLKSYITDVIQKIQQKPQT